MKKNNGNIIVLGWLNHNSWTILDPRGLFNINLIPKSGTVFQMQSLLGGEATSFYL